jgi:F-type H+-transporting ATPase subunit epsilon
MAKLNVDIVTPEKRILSVQADEVICPGFTGLFGVRPGHTPFLSLMEPGALTLKDGSTTQSWFVAGGFVEVGEENGATRVAVLADQAEPASAIDVAAAQQRLTQAQERLKALSETDVQFDVQTAIVRRETARTHVASMHRH